MPTLKMTTNIPVHASLKFADIVPGNFGPQVRLKGTFDGAEGMLFLPGKVWANLKALKSAGVVAPGEYNEEPESPVELPLLHRDVVLTRSQPAGAKYADLVVETNGKAPPQTAPNGKQPVNLGGPLPGEYDDEPAPYHDEPAAVSPAKAMLSLYRECFAESLRIVRALNDDPKVALEFTADNVCSIAATLYIQAQMKGIRSLAA